MNFIRKVALRYHNLSQQGKKENKQMQLEKHMKKIVGVALLAGQSLLLMAQGQDLLDYPARDHVQDNRTLRFACNAFSPQKIAPPSETDLPGYDLDLITAAFERQGHPVEFAFFPWKRAFLLAENGEYDALCSCSWTPERADYFLYSDQMGQVAKGIFTLEGEPVHTLADLKEHTVGVVSGYNLENELSAAEVQKVFSVVDDELLLNLLTYRRVEAIYAYEAPIRGLLKKRGQALNIRFSLLDSSPYYLCVSKAIPDAEAILDKFNHGLRALRVSGRYEQILQRYLPKQYERLSVVND